MDKKTSSLKGFQMQAKLVDHEACTETYLLKKGYERIELVLKKVSGGYIIQSAKHFLPANLKAVSNG